MTAIDTGTKSSTPAPPRYNKNVGKFSATRKGMEDDWWRVLRALRGGTPAMRAEGELLLPKDWSERANDVRYLERLSRSFLFNGYDDSIRRVSGRPFQRPITIGDLPPPLDQLEDNADRCGTSLTVFASRLMEDMADRGFALFLVDSVAAPSTITETTYQPDGTEVPVTRPIRLDEQDALGVRPYFVRILPDNVLGCVASTDRGEEVITEFRVRDISWRQRDDYSEEKVERVTVYKENSVEIWEHTQQTTSDNQAERLRVATECMAGPKFISATDPQWPTGRIPLVVVYANKIGPLYSRPPLVDLAWLNVQHWNSSSEQNWKLHYERCNILKAKGMTHEEAELAKLGKFLFGAGAQAFSSSPDFDMNWVESAGTALDGGLKDLQAIEGRMHALGMSPLTESNGPATATGEVRAEVQQQAEAQKWVEALEWGLYQGIEFAAAWSRQSKMLPADWRDGAPEDFQISIWRDFAITARSTQDLQTLDNARTRKDLSHATYLKEIQKRGVLGDDVDIEQEVTDSEDEQQASLPSMMPAPQQQPPQGPQQPPPAPPKQPPPGGKKVVAA